MEKSLKEMTDEELDEALIKKYGEDWIEGEIDSSNELVQEFFNRQTQAY